MVNCFVSGCHSNNFDTGNTVSYFRIAVGIAENVVLLSGRVDLHKKEGFYSDKLFRNYRICSKHYNSSTDIIKFRDGTRHLKPSALPSVSLPGCLVHVVDQPSLPNEVSLI